MLGKQLGVKMGVNVSSTWYISINDDISGHKICRRGTAQVWKARSHWRVNLSQILKYDWAIQHAGSAGDVLEDDPVGRLKIFVYELPSKYNKKILQKDLRCLTHMFAAEIFMHRFLLSSPVRTLNPKEADWFYTPVYTTCDLTPDGLPLPFKSP
ncbi:hypothetical protein Peur_032510 [Populus x canadensis]